MYAMVPTNLKTLKFVRKPNADSKTRKITDSMRVGRLPPLTNFVGLNTLSENWWLRRQMALKGQGDFLDYRPDCGLSEGIGPNDEG